MKKIIFIISALIMCVGVTASGSVPANAMQTGLANCNERMSSVRPHSDSLKICFNYTSRGNIASGHWYYISRDQGNSSWAQRGIIAVQRCPLNSNSCATVAAARDRFRLDDATIMSMHTSNVSPTGYRYRACGTVNDTRGWHAAVCSGFITTAKSWED